MADLSDVEQTIADTASNILYPQGPSQSSISGVTCRVYRGWPNPATLNSDLNAGIVNVTVSSDNDTGRTTTRYLEAWQYQPGKTALAATTSGRTITISGTAAVGDVVGALIDGVPFLYRVAQGDAPALVAANLCGAISPTRAASVSFNVITIPGSHSIIARAVSDGNASCEARRQEKDIRTIFWCPSPAIRDSIVGAVDAGFAQKSFVILPDNTSGRLTYQSSSTYDQSQNALLYRRDLVYRIEYPTIISVDLPSMLFGASSLNDNVTSG